MPESFTSPPPSIRRRVGLLRRWPHYGVVEKQLMYGVLWSSVVRDHELIAEALLHGRKRNDRGELRGALEVEQAQGGLIRPELIWLPVKALNVNSALLL